MFTEPIEQTTDQHIFSVSELTQCTKDMLEEAFPAIWIEGEISNFACPASGHWYFSLKDSRSQIRAAMFKPRNKMLNFRIDNGALVLVRGKLSLYAPRGDFQLLIEQLELAGEGALRRQFELLKQTLRQQGLFDSAHKKPIPTFVSCLGVITSSTGAAIRDILSVTKRRFPSLPIIIYPTLVQGATAASAIVRAIEIANHRQECDTLIVARGGGSLEDLWPFNEEMVAQAIYRSQIPIVSGIGHEVDFTIADFVADQRAATPSAAAELVTPNRLELLSTILQYRARIIKTIEHRLEKFQYQTTILQKRLLHPSQILQQHAQQLDDLQIRMTKYITQRIERYRLISANLARTLNAVSPLATLERGYAIVENKDRHVIHSAKAVSPEDGIFTRMNDGIIESRVIATHEKV